MNFVIIEFLKAQEDITGKAGYILVADDVSAFVNRELFIRFVRPTYEHHYKAFPLQRGGCTTMPAVQIWQVRSPHPDVPSGISVTAWILRQHCAMWKEKFS